MNKIIEMLKKEGHRNLYSFYCGVYKNVGCGLTIGFRINGKWVYNDSLSVVPVENLERSVDAVRVSSIVEGSDVEVEGDVHLLDGFDEEEFWKSVKEVDKAASFYWERDNSDWMHIVGPHAANLKATDGEYTWGEDAGQELPEIDKCMIQQWYESWYDQEDEYGILPLWVNDVWYPVGPNGEYEVMFYENDATY